MTARTCVFQIYQPNFSEWKASSSLISDFLCVCFFISIREQSDERLFLSVFWMQQSITSPCFLKLLPICTGEEASLNLRASLVPAYYRDKFSFCKKKRIGLCFTDGNRWPSKISNGPPKNGRGPNMALKTTDLGTTLSLHGRMYYLSKFKAYIKKMGPPISMMGPPSYSQLSPKDPQKFNLV